MDYKIFEQLDGPLYGRRDMEDGQNYMERIMRAAFLGGAKEGEERIYEKMQGTFAGCDFRGKALEMEFYVQEWELNPMLSMHGGLLTTAVDMTCGILVRFYKQSVSAATVHLSMDFLKPLRCGEAFTVRARINKQGRRIIFLTAEVVLEDSGQTAATASGTFV